MLSNELPDLGQQASSYFAFSPDDSVLRSDRAIVAFTTQVIIRKALRTDRCAVKTCAYHHERRNVGLSDTSKSWSSNHNTHFASCICNISMVREIAVYSRYG